MGPPRHLALLGEVSAQTIPWPVPFQEGLAQLKALSGQPVVVLASGDPFWFGAGSVIARHLPRDAWQALPGASIFSLVAARLGWPLERTLCLGLHAAPLAQMRRHVCPGARMIVTLRDGAAVSDLCTLLNQWGFGQSEITLCEAVGGPRERITHGRAAELQGTFAHPVAMAIAVQGEGHVMPATTGIPDDFFETDGVMTKRPMRALTLSALAPKPGERLWDLGAGSGSIGIEWCLAHPSCQAVALEPRADRIALIEANAQALGATTLDIQQGTAPEALDGLPKPDVVFIGGGLSAALLGWLETHLTPGTRLVANAVTLESEALLTEAHARLGGTLLRFEIATIRPMGTKRGWQQAYPVVQWSVVL